MLKNTGQSLSEYGLAIGLVVLMGIGGLTLLGSQTADLLGNMIGQKGRGEKNLAMTSSASSVSSAFVLESGFEARSDSMDLTIPVTTLDGRKIQFTVKNYPTKITENDLLTGEDGGTMKLYAKLIQQMAQELFEKNAINEDQFNALRKISESGLMADSMYKSSENNHDFHYKDLLNTKVKDSKPNYGGMNSLDLKSDLNPIAAISSQLKKFDLAEVNAGRSSSLESAFEALQIENTNNNDNKSPSNHSTNTPLQSLILDLSLKLKAGIQLPSLKYNELSKLLEKEHKKTDSQSPDSQTYGQLFELVKNKQKENIHTANLMQNSSQMCGLGKGTVDEAKVQCVKSLPE